MNYFAKLLLIFLINICLATVIFAEQTVSSDRQTEVKTFAPIPPGWWKGNLHTHTLWSDGNGYPEMVVDWYKSHGYHFLTLSDHNVLSQGQMWIDVTRNIGGKEGLENFQEYHDRFGDDWIEQRIEKDKRMVRLKPLNEFRHLFEEPGRFIMIQGEEITDGFGDPTIHIHVNAINLQDLIDPQGGNSVFDVMQNNVNAVLAQRQKTGQPMFPHINHPNFYLIFPHDPKADNWSAITAEDIAKLQGERFFEVYNGSPSVFNYGDGRYVSTERMWDIILTLRLAELKEEIIYGLATDDAHQYHSWGSGHCNPGLGWVVVRSKLLTPEAIVRAMEAGDFYASTGVVLNDIQFDGKIINIQIQPEDGIFYTTQFIGTLKGYDPDSNPMLSDTGKPLPVTRQYSDDIGKVLSEVKGISPAYTFSGNEIYVRAKVISSKPNQNTFDGKPDTELAWTQPVCPSH